MLTAQECKTVRDLAKQIAELSETPEEKQKLQRCKDINALKVVKPPVYMHLPPLAWNQLVSHPDIPVADDRFRAIAQGFQHEIARHHILNTDVPITKTIFAGLCAEVSAWSDAYRTIRATPDGHSIKFQPCINEFSDLYKLHQPELSVDYQKTNEQYETIRDVLGDILDVQKGSPYSSTIGWGDSVIDQFVEMRGLEQFFFDLVDEPGFVHEAMSYMTEKKLKLMEQYKEQGALYLNNSGLIGSASYSYTDELPGNDYCPGQVTEKNLWGYAQAQELSAVSPEMLEEFILPYQAQMMDPFGLVSFGCCDAMDVKIRSAAKFFRQLRIVSVSPYTNHALAAQISDGRFVLACKLHPALMVGYSDEILDTYLQKILTATSGYPTTIIFAEIMGFSPDAGIFTRAIKTARNAIEKYWSDKRI